MRRLRNGYKVYTDGRLMEKTKTELVSIIRELEHTVEAALESKASSSIGSNNIYSGYVDLDKTIFYHEKESFMGCYSGNHKRAEFHNKVVRMLKRLKESNNGCNEQEKRA